MAKEDAKKDDLDTNDVLDESVSERTHEDEPAPRKPKKAEAQEREESRAAPEVIEDPRDRIAKKFRELRDKELAEEQVSAESESDPQREEEDVDPSQEGALRYSSDGEKRQESNKDDQLVELKVNGKIEKVPLSEVISLAQKSRATDTTLDEAKQLVTELRGLRDGQRANHSQETEDVDPSQPEQDQTAPSRDRKTHSIDRDRLTEIARAIQVGDLDEAVDALSDLVETGRPAMSEEQISRVVDTRQSFQQTQQEVNKAIEDFGAQYPVIVKDDELSTIGVNRFMDEIRNDIIGAGIDQNDLKKLGNDFTALANLHRNMRVRGIKLRGYDEIGEKVGNEIYDKFSIPRPRKDPGKSSVPADSEQVETRTDRKRSSALTPRGGAQRQDTKPKQPARKSGADIVAEARAARGFRVTA